MQSTLHKSFHSGFTLIELMIGLLIGLLISIAAVSAFLSHGRAVYQQMSYNQASTDVSEAYAVLSRLVLQARNCDAGVEAITVTTAADKTSTSIDLMLPAGFPVWPNTTAPYNDNWVRVAWASNGANSGQITVTNTDTALGLSTEPAVVFAGANSGNTTRFTGLYLDLDGACTNPLPPTYRFSVSGKSYAQANNTDFDGITMQGRVWPRN